MWRKHLACFLLCYGALCSSLLLWHEALLIFFFCFIFVRDCDLGHWKWTNFQGRYLLSWGGWAGWPVCNARLVCAIHIFLRTRKHWGCECCIFEELCACLWCVVLVPRLLRVFAPGVGQEAWWKRAGGYFTSGDGEPDVAENSVMLSSALGLICVVFFSQEVCLWVMNCSVSFLFCFCFGS